MNAINVAIQAISAVFAFTAAVLWFQSSREEPGKKVLPEIATALINQTVLNARAAICAGLAATFQAIGIVHSILSAM
jgi:hypothetical protein